MNALTLFAMPEGETVKTDKTDGVDNCVFLRTLFPEAADVTRPMLVGFRGNPQRVASGRWAAHAWDGESCRLTPEMNAYFSLGVFAPDASGAYHRRKNRFAGLRAIMLDDVGTKVPYERITLPPTWAIETSPGNFQVGYAFDTVLGDGKRAEQLMNAVIAAGLCDPGANGPMARLARLPVGVNGKHTPPFVCRLAIWAPERRYTFEALVTGLQLELASSGRSNLVRGKAADEGADPDTIWISKPAENPVLAALRERGLYKTPLGSGKHDITCPRVHEHTDGVDRGTAYFEPDDTWPLGGFKCLHGHCTEQGIRDLLEFLGVETRVARMKPTLRVINGELHRIVDGAERELARAGQYYQRGGKIVTLSTDRATGEVSIQEISQPALVHALSAVASWERYDERSKGWVRIDPPSRVSSVLFDVASYNHLPILSGLTRQPYQRADGSLMTQPGYDTVSGMFGVFNAEEFAVPESPSREDAQRALAEISGLLDEFCFASEFDRSAALSAILTAALRQSLPLAPMFHVRAPVPGSGKSYLCELITGFATPQRSTPMSFPSSEEECKKLLLAEFQRGPAVIEFDNMTTDVLPHKSLCTSLTSEYFSGRILRESRTAKVSTRTFRILTTDPRN